VQTLEDQAVPNLWAHKITQHYFSDSDPWTSTMAGTKPGTPWVGGTMTIISRLPLRPMECPYLSMRNLQSGLRPSLFRYLLSLTGIPNKSEPDAYNCCLYVPDRRRSHLQTMLSVAGATYHVARWQFMAVGPQLRSKCCPADTGKYMQSWIQSEDVTDVVQEWGMLKHGQVLSLAGLKSAMDAKIKPQKEREKAVDKKQLARENRELQKDTLALVTEQRDINKRKLEEACAEQQGGKRRSTASGSGSGSGAGQSARQGTPVGEAKASRAQSRSQGDARSRKVIAPSSDAGEVEGEKVPMEEDAPEALSPDSLPRSVPAWPLIQEFGTPMSPACGSSTSMTESQTVAESPVPDGALSYDDGSKREGEDNGSDGEDDGSAAMMRSPTGFDGVRKPREWDDPELAETTKPDTFQETM
jgi:hypothetical protein